MKDEAEEEVITSVFILDGVDPIAELVVSVFMPDDLVSVIAGVDEIDNKL